MTRIQIPSEYSEDNVTVTANALFVHFANDLSQFINAFMTSKFGVAWLQNLKVEDSNYKSFNPKDPAALLKDLAKYGGSKLRQALHSKIERGFLKQYLEDLDDLLGERNAWLHRQVQETEAELLDLVTTLLRVGKPLGLKIIDDCMAIQDSILNPNPTIPEEEVVVEEPLPEAIMEESKIVVPLVEPVPLVKEPAKEVAVDLPEPETISILDIVEIAGLETSQIGDEVKERLLSHSYVLHVNGDIRDRASEELLIDVNPASAQSLGAFLISRKPAGGRIRITEDGTLCAFFGEKWGYLARVKSQDWFPNHLHVSHNKQGDDK
jgi:hypothetical protein